MVQRFKKMPLRRRWNSVLYLRLAGLSFPQPGGEKIIAPAAEAKC
jgi:hypothetical protein